MHFVYVIQNNVTKKVYVGVSVNPQTRWKGHRSCANSGRRKNRFYDAIRSYGAENFTLSIIEEHANAQECAEAECFWIEYFRSWDPAFGYNLNMGGSLGIPTKEARKKMSEAAKRRGANNKGMKFSEEACENIKQGCAKRGKAWLENLRAGLKKRDEAWRENCRRAALRRWRRQKELNQSAE